jgi:Domain of unknown function (DUF4111)
MPPPGVLAYAELVAGELVTASGGLLRAAYLHGSAVLGGWVPGRSDVDLLLVTAGSIPAQRLDSMASVLVATAGSCPGRGLECSVAGADQVAAPGPPWPFLLHVVTGSGEPGGGRVQPGAASSGDPDLLMHYAVCLAAGWPVYGPPAQQLIGEVLRPAILDYLAEELCWGLDHAPQAYAVLNACRAAVYLTDGQIVSKIDGAQTALRRGTGPADVIRRALGQQRGSLPDGPPGPDAADFVLVTAAALRTAAAGPQALGPADPGRLS